MQKIILNLETRNQIKLLRKRIQCFFVVPGRCSPYSDDGFLEGPSGPPPRPQGVNRPPVPATAPNRESPDPFTSQAKQQGQEVGRIYTALNKATIPDTCKHNFG